MNFVSLRIITDDVNRLVGFYEEITGCRRTGTPRTSPNWRRPPALWRLAAKRTMDLFGAGAARAADNHSAIIEFRVEDVDKEYERLETSIGEFVQAPTTMPWGNRSLLFRDPDGNLINFFTPVTAEAVKNPVP